MGAIAQQGQSLIMLIGLINDRKFNKITWCML